MCRTSHLATHTPPLPPLRSEVPMPWHTVTADVHNANVSPSKMAERGANASPGAVLADRNANGATEDGLLPVNKHTAGRTEGGKDRTPFPPQPHPPWPPNGLSSANVSRAHSQANDNDILQKDASSRTYCTVLYCTRNLARGSLFRVVPLSELAPSRKAMMSLKRCA